MLYRRVKHGRNQVKVKDGQVRPSSQAFTGHKPKFRISVDRAELCDKDPAHTQQDTSDYICSVVAGEVRSIDAVIQNSPKGKEIRRHNIDIEYTPNPEADPENDAHADIYPHPELANKQVFRKLQERLALMARWEEGFEPTEPN